MNSNERTNYNPRSSEDEIDLGKLFEKIGNFFLNILSTVFRNIKTLIIIGLIPVVFAIAYYFLQKPVFTSELVLNSRFLTTNLCSNLIGTLNRYVEEENYAQLQHNLKMENNLSESIKKIDFSYLIDEKKLEDTPDSALRNAPFKVVVRVDNSKVFDSLGYKIKAYIENNPYARKREIIEKENIRNTINILITQRESLDSLKRLASASLFSPRGGKDALVYGEPYEPLNIYRQQLEYYNRELELRKQLIESESVEILQNFTKFRKPKRPVGLIKSVFYGAIIGLILGVLYLIMKELGQSLRRYEQSRINSTVQ